MSSYLLWSLPVNTLEASMHYSSNRLFPFFFDTNQLSYPTASSQTSLTPSILPHFVSLSFFKCARLGQLLLSHGLICPANHAWEKAWDLRCRQRDSHKPTCSARPFSVSKGPLFPFPVSVHTDRSYCFGLSFCSSYRCHTQGLAETARQVRVTICISIPPAQSFLIRPSA